MSFIGKNIKKIRSIKKMSQSDFAHIFDLARPSVGAYEEGRSEPKIETIIAIARHFKISIDALLTKELTIDELFKHDLFRKEISIEDLNLKNDKDEVEEQTPLVTLDKMLDYIVNYKNKDFINSLPVIHFPFTQTKKSRAFQIFGQEMEYEQTGLHHKDILLCSPVDTVDDLCLNELYIVISKREIVVRRFEISKDKLHFKADNPAYDTLKIEENDILEIWKAEAVFSNQLKSPSRLEERVSLLEDKMNELMAGIRN